jgi:hypothetical protein
MSDLKLALSRPDGRGAFDAHERRTAIMVLGMHRSGTSALTRVLSLCGASLPRNKVPGDGASNPQGHWEPARIVDIHDRFLEQAGYDWHDTMAFPSQIFETENAATCQRRLIQVAWREYWREPLFVIKDPRASRLMPLWRGVFAELQASPRIVIAVRNPIEIADSLRRRDAWDEHHALVVWMRHMLSAERDTRGLRRCFISYDQLLDDWRSVVSDITDQLDLEPGRMSIDATAIDNFLRRDLRHHRRSAAEVFNRNDIADCIKRTYRVFCHAVESGGIDSIELDAISRILDRAEAVIGDIRTTGQSGPIQAIAASDPDIAERDAVFALLTAELGRARLRAKEFERRLQNMLTSTSWRLTRPYRAAGSILNRLRLGLRSALGYSRILR